jgi:NAD+ synthase (glutamine-hydrolysing)
VVTKHSKKLLIAGATVNQTPIDWSTNTSNILEAIREARAARVDILCFPEMSIAGYGSEDLFLSDWVSQRAFDELLKIRAECDGLVVCVGLPVRMEGITYNGACVIDNKKILGITLKQNLARDGVHYEPRWFDAGLPGETKQLQPGDEIIPVGDIIYEVKGITLGFEICEDAWRKDRPGYRLHQRKVDLILNPSASHFAMGKSVLREQQVVLEGSEKFECVYGFVNLLGNEAGRMIYDGDIIFAQRGKLLAVNRRLSFRNFNLLACTIDFENPEQTPVIPSLDSKERNEEFVRATSLALYDYLRKSKARGFVLSLSGGADSSCCAVLVAEMVRRASEELGWDKFCKTLGIAPTTDRKTAVRNLLTCAYQGTKNSSQETRKAAGDLAESLGAQYHQWLIDDEVNSYSKKIETVLERPLNWEMDDIALQNIQARSRSPVIWLLANVKQSILLTTSNRSEGDVGYATMDGDTSGSLAPIAGIDKPFLLQWLKWAEIHLGYTGLHLVNRLQPTAELRPPERSQTDEKDLMPYPVLLAIERLSLYDRKPPAEIYKTLLPDYPDHAALKGYIKKFFKLWSANQWKRERLAPSFHLDDWNVDPRSWCRFPILSGNFDSELEDLESW